MKADVVRDVLSVNDEIAEGNRQLLRAAKLPTINLMSAPGAGKTTLLERTVAEFGRRFRIGVIEGDIQGSLDADRLRRAGAETHQINTQGACHLDAQRVRTALEQLPLSALDFLVIENVGNLVCPAEFDLGEDAKVMLLSVPEGDDKPAKYPLMFEKAALLLVSKLDLLPHCRFDLAKVERDSRVLNPDLRVLRISSVTGEGLPAWFDWITARIEGGRTATTTR